MPLKQFVVGISPAGVAYVKFIRIFGTSRVRFANVDNRQLILTLTNSAVSAETCTNRK